jgi:hypothetical protein
MSDDFLTETIIALCAAAGPGKSIDPTEAAKFCARRRQGDQIEDDLAWRALLPRVRAKAVALARQGRLVIYRKGKPADPDDFRGVYRLGLPRGE